VAGRGDEPNADRAQIPVVPMSTGTTSAWTSPPEPRRQRTGPGRQDIGTGPGRPDEAVGALRAEVERALAGVSPETVTAPLTDARRAETALRAALRRLPSALLDALTAAPEEPLRQGLACAEAACEHLHHGELVEARMLLVATRGQLARAVTVRRRRPASPPAPR
jgi:hypothetical protein